MITGSDKEIHSIDDELWKEDAMLNWTLHSISWTTFVDYTGKWGIHEAFLHNSSGNYANVTRFGQLGHKEVPHL